MSVIPTLTFLNFGDQTFQIWCGFYTLRNRTFCDRWLWQHWRTADKSDHSALNMKIPDKWSSRMRWDDFVSNSGFKMWNRTRVSNSAKISKKNIGRHRERKARFTETGSQSARMPSNDYFCDSETETDFHLQNLSGDQYSKFGANLFKIDDARNVCCVSFGDERCGHTDRRTDTQWLFTVQRHSLH